MAILLASAAVLALPISYTLYIHPWLFGRYAWNSIPEVAVVLVALWLSKRTALFVFTTAFDAVAERNSKLADFSEDFFHQIEVQRQQPQEAGEGNHNQGSQAAQQWPLTASEREQLKVQVWAEALPQFWL